LIVWEEFWAWCRLGGASGKALSSVSLEFSIYGRDTALEECGDGFECGHHVGWFRVVRGGAACTLVLVYVSIRLRESVSFRSIERFRTPDTVQQDLQAQQFLIPLCDHTEMETTIQVLTTDRDNASRRPIALATDKVLWEDEPVMTQDAE